MKYICYIGLEQLETIIVFPPYIKHSRMASLIGDDVKELLSAGFVSSLSSEGISCHGHSQSLKLKSRERDTLLLEMQIGKF